MIVLVELDFPFKMMEKPVKVHDIVQYNCDHHTFCLSINDSVRHCYLE